MDDDPIGSDELQISEKTYIKLSEALLKTGYKDGISDGKDTKFQDGFDRGYKEGFKNAFVMGEYKGTLQGVENHLEFKEIAKIAESDLLLKQPDRGHCQICTNQNLINENLNDISDTNKRHIADVHSELDKKYESVSNFFKIKG